MRTRVQYLFAAAVLCPGITLTAPVKPPLTADETRLVCGDKTNTEGKSEGWSHIPLNQGLFELQNLFQIRGYLKPSIQRSGDAATVDPGPLVKVRSVRMSGDAPEVDPSRKRHVIGEPLTPKILTAEEKWVKAQLEHEGYPCADVKATGDLEGNMTVSVLRGERGSINRIDVNGTRNLDPAALRRYDPFKFGQTYDDHLLAISADRAVTDGVVERSYFAPVCPAGYPRQDVIEGQPHITTYALGLNTEEIAVLQASVEKVRMGANASSAFLGAQAFYQAQEINAHSDWRVFGASSKSWLRPQALVRHENENPYVVFQEQGSATYRTQWDWLGAGFGASLGPEVNVFQTQAGGFARNPQQTALAGEFGITSHEFEFTRSELTSGFRFQAQAESSTESVLSNFGATRVRGRFEKIWNPGSYDPAWLLVRLHLGYLATFVEGGPSRASKLPPNYFGYLGGNSSLRGFGRLELGSGYPNESLSAGFASLELEPDLLNAVKPLVFADAGLLSYRTYGLQVPVFWSPGVGLTWQSPVGPVRATASHGFISGNGAHENPQDHITSTHWQFFVSLGEPL